MSRWSRRDEEPPPPERDAGGSSWNPDHADPDGAEATEAQRWVSDRERRTPLEQALSRRAPSSPDQPAVAEPEPEPGPEPPPSVAAPQPGAARADVQATRSSVWRLEQGLPVEQEQLEREAGEARRDQERREAELGRMEGEARAERERELDDLRRRLERAERALPPSLRAEAPGLGERARLWSSTAFRLLVSIAIFAVFVTAPLLMIYRSTCPVRGLDRERWSFVPPGGDKPEGCRDHRNGLQVLLGQD